VRAVLATFVGRNLVELPLEDVAKFAMRDPWVKEATIKRILPGTLRVTIKERTPGALALIRGSVHVVDDGGFDMGSRARKLPFDLPLLVGLEGRRGDGLDFALTSGVALLMRLHDSFPTWTRGISEVDLSRSDRVVVTRLDGGPRYSSIPNISTAISALTWRCNP
jgi:cell division protein FtsQ